MKHQLRIFAIAALLHGTWQCTGSGDHAAGQEGAASWSVDSTPIAVLGGIENEAASISIGVGATRLPDGQILVADRGEFGLLFFDVSGHLLRRAVRKGKGPGEVEFLANAWRCDTLLYVFDIDGYRISEFTLDGTFQRSFRFAQVDKNSVPYASACNVLGEFIHYGWDLARGVKPGVHRPQVAAWTSKADSLLAFRLPDIAGSERWVTTRGSRPLGLGKETQIAAGANSFYIGQATTYAIDVVDFRGDTLRTITRPFTPQPIGRADIAAAIEREVAESGEKWRKSVEHDFETMELPAHAPPYRRLLVDSDEHLWVQDYPLADRSAVTWSVFLPNGEHLADVSLAADLEVFEIGRDYVLGRRLNAGTGAPEVHLYRLTRTRR